MIISEITNIHEKNFCGYFDEKMKKENHDNETGEDDMASTAVSKKFADRLDTLLSEAKARGKDNKSVSRDLGISTGALSNYSNDVQQANITTARTIAEYFGVSVDWLLGLTDVRPQDTTLQEVCRYTGLSENLVEYLHKSENQQYLDRLISRVLFLPDWDNGSYDTNPQLAEMLIELLSYSQHNIDDSMLGIMLDVYDAQIAHKKGKQWTSEERRAFLETPDIRSAQEAGYMFIYPEMAYRHHIELAVAAFRRIVTAMVEKE